MARRLNLALRKFKRFFKRQNSPAKLVLERRHTFAS